MSPEPIWRRYARFFRPDVGADIDDEMEFHIEERARELMNGGLGERVARAQARTEFGNAGAARAEVLTIHGDDTKRRTRARRLADLGQDVRYALRSARRKPAGAALVAVTLALGLGATTAILSVVNGILLRPLPYRDPGQLTYVYEWSPTGDDHNPVSNGNYLDWKTRNRSFSVMGAHYLPYSITLSGDGEATRVVTMDGTPSLFALLGVEPQLGRLFTEDDAKAETPMLLISDAMWRNRFGADPAILSRRVTVEGRTWAILGVMPRGFAYPDAGVAIWRPVPESRLDGSERRAHNLRVVGRLRDGVTPESAQSDLSGIASQLAGEFPQFMKGWRVNVTSMHEDIVGPVRPLIVVLLVGAALLLVVACGNAANLLLSRALTRSREIAVRGALGAGGFRIARQLLVESFLLALMAALAGTGVAALSLKALIALAPADLPRLDQVRLDPTVLGWSALIALGCTIAVGLAPALRLARVDLQSTLRSVQARGDRHGRLRGGLVVLEVAVSLVMLIGAGLLVRSFERLQRVDYGFEPAGLVAAAMSLPRSKYAEPTAQFQFFSTLQERLSAIPGVRSASGSSQAPADAYPTTFSFAIQGKESPNPSGRFDAVPVHVVMPGYFATLGIPLLHGRVPDERDRAGAPPVVVVNQSLARLLWGAETPVGSHIAFAGPEGPWLEVVGVVGDTRATATDAAPGPLLYAPYLQKRWGWLNWQNALIRVGPGMEITAVAEAFRAILREMDPDVAVSRFATVEELYAEGQAHRRLAAVLLAGFAVAALLLGVIGLYGVMSNAVSERRQEIGVRMALGADRPAVLGMVLSQATRLILIGVCLGVVAAVTSTKLLTSLLYETSPLDPVTYVVVTAGLVALGLMAALIPARRATAIEPVTAIRE
jgi:predicted permease